MNESENRLHPIFKKPLASENEFRSELDKFPDIATLQKSLTELMSIDMSLMSREEIRQTFFKRAHLQPFSFAAFRATVVNSLQVYRTRSWINEQTEDLSNPKTFSYPPPKFCMENGRANLRGSPVFYCSDQAGTSMAETKPIKGDVLFLGKWSVDCTREWRISSFLPPNIPGINPWLGFAQNHQREVQKHALQYGMDKAEYVALVTNFLTNAFVRELPPYCLTSWLSDEVLYGYSEIDMLVYPSFITGANTCNLAMKPAFTDEFLRLERVYKILINSINDVTMNYRTQAVGKVQNGIVTWGAPTDNDEQELPGKMTKIAT